MGIHTEDREIQNAIGEAIYLVLGGVREAAKVLDVSTQSVYQLLGAEIVKNRETALKIASATRDAGCEVPAAELMKLVDWDGESRHPDKPRGKRGPNGSSPRQSPVVKLPAGGGTEAGREVRASGRLRRASGQRRATKPRELSGICIERLAHFPAPYKRAVGEN